jgi:AcrR family transcriptional regulator
VVDKAVYNGKMKADTRLVKQAPARERILLTAHRLFYAEGIRATGIDRVIEEAGVTKVTFYRHFPSKNDLVCTYLEYRHQRWMAWFADALQRHGSANRGAGVNALIPALSEWFCDEGFRGCAFLNGVGEIGCVLPQALEITRRHKQDMTAAIAGLLPGSRRREKQAQAIALAVDGAIVRAQFDETPDGALHALGEILKSLQTDGKPARDS